MKDILVKLKKIEIVDGSEKYITPDFTGIDFVTWQSVAEDKEYAYGVLTLENVPRGLNYIEVIIKDMYKFRGVNLLKRDVRRIANTLA